MQYVVVYEQAPENWAAYVPGLPGCVAAADTREEVKQLSREAIALYVEAMRQRGAPVPEAGRWTQLVDM